MPSFLTTARLSAGVPHVVAAPAVTGTVDMIVCRPEVGKRTVLDKCELVVGEGLDGDNYLVRGDPRTEDGSAHPEAQLNVMSSRAIDLVADGDRERWALAGDQFFVDYDLSTDNLPTGTRLQLGTAVVEVTAIPHNGCAKFADRYGKDAARWVNSSKVHRFRGINAKVVQPGEVQTGDQITKT